MDSINIQAFIQWVVTVAISLVATVVSLKSSTKKLETDIETVNSTIKKGFDEINNKIESLRTKLEQNSKEIAVLKFRVDAMEKTIEKKLD